jgi:hypothetical protein
MNPHDWIEEEDHFESFDELMFGAIRYEDVKGNYMPRHLSRRDLRAWKRDRWFDEFDTRLAIGGIVAGALIVFLMGVGFMALAVSK